MGTLVVLPLVSALALLVACSADDGPSKEDLQSRIDALQGQVSELQSQLEEAQAASDEVRDKAAAVATASQDLQDNVDRMQAENWRDVVPDVQGSSEDVETAQGDLTQAVDDLPTQ